MKKLCIAVAALAVLAGCGGQAERVIGSTAEVGQTATRVGDSESTPQSSSIHLPTYLPAGCQTTTEVVPMDVQAPEGGQLKAWSVRYNCSDLILNFNVETYLGGGDITDLYQELLDKGSVAESSVAGRRAIIDQRLDSVNLTWSPVDDTAVSIMFQGQPNQFGSSAVDALSAQLQRIAESTLG